MLRLIPSVVRLLEIEDDLKAPQLRLRSAPVVVVNRVQQVEHRINGAPASTYPVDYRWGDLADRYAFAVADSIAAGLGEQNRTAAGGAAELGLDLLGLEQLFIDGSGNGEVLDRVSAIWRLGYRERIFAEVYVTGEARGPRGQPGRLGEQASERATRALQDLLVNTVDALSRDADLRRFARIPRVYLEPGRALEHARAALARDQSPEMLAALRRRAVEHGHADVYRLVTERARVDESDLLHAAICSPYHDPDIYLQVLGRSSNPNQFDATRAGTLQAALRCGREALVQGLVDAGAHPAIEFDGDAYISAELNFRLTQLLRPGSKALRRAAGYAGERYAEAIAAAEAAIEQQRARAFLADFGRLFEDSAAAAPGAGEPWAQAGAMRSGLGAYSDAIYVNPQPEIASEEAAVRHLRDRIRHCRARLQRLEPLS